MPLRWGLVLLLLLPLGWRAIATPQARAELWPRWRPLSALGLLGDLGCYNALQYLALTGRTALNVTLTRTGQTSCRVDAVRMVGRARPVL